MLLDDIVTPGIRRTRSVPQGDPCAADLFGAALDRPTGKFMDMRQQNKWGLPVGEDTWAFLSLRTTAGSLVCGSVSDDD